MWPTNLYLAQSAYLHPGLIQLLISVRARLTLEFVSVRAAFSGNKHDCIELNVLCSFAFDMLIVDASVVVDDDNGDNDIATCRMVRNLWCYIAAK